MVQDTKLALSLHFDTETILFKDASTGDSIFIDGSGIPSPGEAPPDHETTKLDLCQHFLLHHLDRNGIDCRPLSKLLGGNNLKTLLPLVVDLHMGQGNAVRENRDGEGGDKKEDVEAGIRGVHRLLGQMISMMEQRELARDKLIEARQEDEREGNEVKFENEE